MTDKPLDLDELERRLLPKVLKEIDPDAARSYLDAYDVAEILSAFPELIRLARIGQAAEITTLHSVGSFLPGNTVASCLAAITRTQASPSEGGE